MFVAICYCGIALISAFVLEGNKSRRFFKRYVFKSDAPPCVIHVKSGNSPRIDVKNRSKYRTPLHVNVHPELCKTETDFFRELTLRFSLYVSVFTVPHERR